MSAQPKPVEPPRRPVPKSVTVPLPFRQIPESITLTSEQYLDLLGYLFAADSLFDDLAGYTPSPAGESLFLSAIGRFNDNLVGEIAEVDEFAANEELIDRDPIDLQMWVRGERFAAAVLEAMAAQCGDHGLVGAEEILNTQDPAETLRRLAEKKRTNADEILAAGSILGTRAAAAVAA